MIKEFFQYTPFQVSSWYFFVLAGIVVSVTLAVLKTPKENFPLTKIGVFACSLLIVYLGMMGGKLLYMYLHWEELMKFENITPKSLFATAGYASVGTFLFQILAVFLFTKARINRVSFLKAADYLVPFTFLAQGFVRIGCFFNGCCYGSETDLPWGVVFPGETEVPVHPTQIYSMLYLFLIFIVARFIYNKALPRGTAFFGTLFLYSIFRFFNEFLRVDSFPIYGTITLAQVTMAAVFFISAVSLTIIFLKRRKS